MAIHITQIGKHKFICGLFWQSLSRPRELFKEAGELAKKIDSDLMVLRKDHSTAQAGFAHTRDGARRMVYSLGAVVSKTMACEGATYDGQKQAVHNWLGAFKLPDGKWAYFAVRDANFLPNGDFAGTKDEVLDRLHGDYGLGGWNVVIGDAELEEYGFHNFSAKRIEDLIPHKKNGQIKIYNWWGLRPVDSKISWVPVAIVGFLFIFLIVGGYIYWQQYQHQKEEQLRELAIEAARQKMLGNGKGSMLPHPWPSMPLSPVIAKTCFDNLTHLTAGGWLLDSYVCNANSAMYTWVRQDSTIDFLLSQVPDAKVDLSSNKATLTIPFQLANGGDEILLDAKNILEPLISRLQLMNISAQIGLIASPPQPLPQASLPGVKAQEVPKPDWQTFSFVFATGGLSPTEIARMLSGPGIRINKLSYRSGEWSIEGVIYAKLP
ncbi:type 4b pilus protein PilO2 [Undibacterium sp. SXout7W]|uniref:type 4b pilus protein PilO2 n=1 Tax=Undibacterium sp. SXout7W TaxID=3413049 RepID=UPI003BF3FBCA